MIPIFSATPPLEAIRVLVAKLSSEDPATTKDPLKAMLVDVSRAHFYAPAVRDVFIELPREDPRYGDEVTCGRLLKTMYGTLDAAEQCGLRYTRTLIDAGFVQGTASPCHFVHHRATADLWVQQRVKSGEVSLGKLPGTENPSDAMTKFVAASDLAAHCGRMSLQPWPGRPACVPAHEEQVIGSLRASDDHDLDPADRPECPRRCRVPDRLLTAGVPALSSEPGVLWMRRPGGSYFQSRSR